MTEVMDILAEAESPEFYTSQNLASTLAGFVAGIERSSIFLRLVSGMSRGIISTSLLHSRIAHLSAEPIDGSYESAFDVAIATYLLALNRNSPWGAVSSADAVRSSAQLWWAKKIANTLDRRVVPCVTMVEPRTAIGHASVGPARARTKIEIEPNLAAGNVDLVLWETQWIAAEVRSGSSDAANGNIAFGTYTPAADIPNAVVAHWALGRA